DVDLGWPPGAGPHVEVLAVRREDLDAVALAVGDVDLAGVLPDATDRVKLVRANLGVAELPGVADLAPRFQQLALRRVLVDAAVAVAVRDVDLAVWADADVGRVVERGPGVADAVLHRQAAAGEVRIAGLADVAGVAGVG